MVGEVLYGATKGEINMTPNKPDATEAAERVRRYFDSCCRPGKDRRLEDSIDNDLRAVAVAYLAQQPTYAEQSAEIAAMTAERDRWKQKYYDLLNEYDAVNEGI